MGKIVQFTGISLQKYMKAPLTPRLSITPFHFELPDRMYLTKVRTSAKAIR